MEIFQSYESILWFVKESKLTYSQKMGFPLSLMIARRCIFLKSWEVILLVFVLRWQKVLDVEVVGDASFMKKAQTCDGCCVGCFHWITGWICLCYSSCSCIYYVHIYVRTVPQLHWCIGSAHKCCSLVLYIIIILPVIFSKMPLYMWNILIYHLFYLYMGNI